MAVKSKRTKSVNKYSKPSSSSYKPKRRKKIKKKSSKDKKVIIEISLIAGIGASILLFISFFSRGGGGFLGRFFTSLLKGLFGFGGYIIPIVMVLLCLYILIGFKKKVNKYKIISCVILYFILIGMIHLFSFNEDAVYSTATEYIRNNYSAGTFNNGGLIGACVGDGFVKILGKIGTYIFFVVSTIILMILITGKSFFNLIDFIYDKITYVISGNGDYDDYDDYEDYDDYDDEVEYEQNYSKKGKKVSDYVDKYERQDKRKNIKAVKEEKLKKPLSNKITITENVDENNSKKGKIVTIDIKRDDSKKDKKKISLFMEEIDKKRNPVINDITDVKRDTPQFIRDINNIEKDDDINISDDDDYNDIEQTKKFEINTDKYIDEADRTLENVRTRANLKVIELNNIEEQEEEPVIFQAELKRPLINPISESTLKRSKYKFPKIDLLEKNPVMQTQSSKEEILKNSRILVNTLKSFGVEAKVNEISKGPTVTRYELTPGVGTRVNKISSLEDDIALSLAAKSIRIEAPIPGKKAVGIEIPNKEVLNVYLSEVIGDSLFQKFPSKLAFGLGKDIAGNVIVSDIAKMPHMLIAGATGSGKSVCINTLITSILYKANPDEVKLIMVDPKVVELSVYNGIPHLLIPVVTDPKKAAGALNWAVKEMMSRYSQIAAAGVRNLQGFNEILEENREEKLPQIVIIIDELADLMMVAKKEVEDSICRLAQLARAAGIHLIIATQRPSVDVITGLIKANIPSRIAFAVSSSIDSRTILDVGGAEKLLGKGDMLFKSVDMDKPLRVQGAFISDKEVENIVKFIKKDNKTEYDEEVIDKITASFSDISNSDSNIEKEDNLTDEAISFVVKKGKASVSMLQRQFRIGYNRAARIIEELEQRGIVGPEDGSKPRAVYMDKYELEEYFEEDD